MTRRNPDLSSTEKSTGRSGGRPKGLGGYADQDRLLFSEITSSLKPTLLVRTLRDAVRPLVARIAGGGSAKSKCRRVERRYRTEVST